MSVLLVLIDFTEGFYLVLLWDLLGFGVWRSFRLWEVGISGQHHYDRWPLVLHELCRILFQAVDPCAFAALLAKDFFWIALHVCSLFFISVPIPVESIGFDSVVIGLWFFRWRSFSSTVHIRFFVVCSSWLHVYFVVWFLLFSIAVGLLLSIGYCFQWRLWWWRISSDCRFSLELGFCFGLIWFVQFDCSLGVCFGLI